MRWSPGAESRLHARIRSSGRLRRNPPCKPQRSGCCLAPGCSGRVAWNSESLTSVPYFDPTEQRDFGQIHMVQMVLFCPLFEGSGAGNAVRLGDYP